MKLDNSHDSRMGAVRMKGIRQNLGRMLIRGFVRERLTGELPPISSSAFEMLFPQFMKHQKDGEVDLVEPADSEDERIRCDERSDR